MENRLVFLPVENTVLNDLYDWAKAEEKCKTTNVTLLSPVSSPRKNGVKIIKNNNNVGCRTRSNEQDIALFKHGSRVYAIKADCPHAGGPLDLGDIEDFEDRLCVRCPWHGWRIELDTGEVLAPKGHRKQSTKVYPVKVSEEGKIYIGFESLDSKYFNFEEMEF